MIPAHECRIQEARNKGSEGRGTQAKNANVPQAGEAQGPAEEILRQARADQCFKAVADEPAQNHRGRHTALPLSCAMRRESGDEDQPPDTGRGEQQRSQ